MIKEDCVMYDKELGRCVALKETVCSCCAFYKNAKMYAARNNGRSYEEELKLAEGYVHLNDVR